MKINRRLAIQALLGGAVTTPLLRTQANEGQQADASATAPGLKVLDLKTISQPTDRYYGWPTVARRSNGDLLLVASGGRQHHVCPFGRVDLLQSFDQGDSWTFARTIADGPIDDRDAGILETTQGTLLVTTFTSLAYEPILQKAEATAGTDKPSMPAEQLRQWRAAHARLAPGEHAQHLGCWMLRSEDGGLNWSNPSRCPLNSPHGPTQLRDGSLLYAGKMLWEEPHTVGVCRSTDDGRNWSAPLAIPTRPGDSHQDYHELHGVEAADGTLIVHIRNHNTAHKGETLQTHSGDGGRTWATPYSIGVWGLPSHLLKLRDGRLLMTYGHRRQPLGNQARISEDHGRSWSAPLVLYGDGTSGDLGYPSTVELSDGRLLTVWYERLAGNPLSQLRAARWRLG
ncbi:MAG: exo-alpha-sialidase [Planctomycetales bacterium]|nr:exo-alpha-sialidase [Planctomycetales bacterium]